MELVKAMLPFPREINLIHRHGAVLKLDFLHAIDRHGGNVFRFDGARIAATLKIGECMFETRIGRKRERLSLWNCGGAWDYMELLIQPLRQNSDSIAFHCPT